MISKLLASLTLSLFAATTFAQAPAAAPVAPAPQASPVAQEQVTEKSKQKKVKKSKKAKYFRNEGIQRRVRFLSPFRNY